MGGPVAESAEPLTAGIDEPKRLPTDFFEQDGGGSLLMVVPVGVRLMAATMGLLAMIMVFRLVVPLLRGAFDSPVLYPAYWAIGVSFSVALIMFFLYRGNELARKLTIFICILSGIVSGWTLINLYRLDVAVPIPLIVNYALRFSFSIFFTLYLMTPGVRLAFHVPFSKEATDD